MVLTKRRENIMYIEGRWYEACELSAYIKELKQERDKYKAEVDRLLKVIEDKGTEHEVQ
jgi:lipocalin